MNQCCKNKSTCCCKNTTPCKCSIKTSTTHKDLPGDSALPKTKTNSNNLDIIISSIEFKTTQIINIQLFQNLNNLKDYQAYINLPLLA